MSLICVATALVSCLTACGLLGESCVGSQHGDVTLVASRQGEDPGRELPGGGIGYVQRVDFDAEPATVRINARGEENRATRSFVLAVGESFEVDGTSYTVEGFCERKAYLTSDSG